MADPTLHGLPNHLHLWLKQQADLHHRSIDEETVAVPEAAGTQRRRPVVSADGIMAAAKRFAALPVLDHRSADEILGYDDSGLPG